MPTFKTFVPLAGNSTRFGPDTTQVRDYTYDDGIEAKLESTINFGKVASCFICVLRTFFTYLFWPARKQQYKHLKPRITVTGRSQKFQLRL